MQSPINQTNLDKIKSVFTQKKLLRFDGPTTANIIVTKLICLQEKDHSRQLYDSTKVSLLLC